MFRTLTLLALVFTLFSCGGGKRSLNTEETMSVDEFVESFPELKLPFTVHDSSLGRKLNDSLLISAKLIRQFVPDTVFREQFRTAKPKFYAYGRAEDKNGDHYLLVKAATPTKQAAYLLCYDKVDSFKAGMPLVVKADNRKFAHEGSLDKRFTITRSRKRTGPDGQILFSRNVYVYNNVGTFTLILTESNEVAEQEDIYNPIDTLTANRKWTGDYVKNKKNFVAVRDGSRANTLLFFVHFEKNNGDCVGELKGEADLVGPGLARYSAPGDPCTLDLQFENTRVTLREISGCGNHRGIKCFFNDSYPKKQVKSKKKTRSKAK
jgi:hypothetical protein